MSKRKGTKILHIIRDRIVGVFQQGQNGSSSSGSDSSGMSASGAVSGATAPPVNDPPADNTESTSKGKGRVRTCKACKFTCTNAREFSNHVRTAHGEGKEEEEENSAPPPSGRRASLRQKRASSSAPNTANGAGSSAAGNNVATPTSSTSASNSSAPASSVTTRSSASIAQSNKKANSSNNSSDTGASTSAQVNGTSSASANKSSPDNSTKDNDDGENTTSTNAPVGSTDSTATAHSEPVADMIATSAPTATAVSQPSADYLNMSSYSEDENDLGEDCGRLIIDDSSAANGSSGVTPTRCGNIQNRTYVCGVCDFTTTSAKANLHHQKEAHKFDIVIYECDICDYATKYKQKLPRHRKLHFSGQDASMDAGQASDGTEPPATTSTSQLSTSTNTAVPSTSRNGPTVEAVNGNDEPIPSTSTGLRGEGLPPVIVDDDEDEDEENGSKHSDSPVHDIVEIPDREPEEKKKKRQEVDPAKYFEVVEETGTKFACSSCGNSYKWRKSLNKHWKEKHNGETPDNSRFPAGMRSVVQSGHHTPGGRRRLYHNQLLQKITVNQDEDFTGGIIEDGASNGSANSSRAATPQNFLNGSYNGNVSHGSGGEGAGLFLPGMIGPFISGQAAFPGASTEQFKSLTASLNGPIPSQHALDLSRRSSPMMDETDSLDQPSGTMQNEPLNLALHRPNQQSPINLSSIKTEQPWDESPEDVPAMDTSALDDDTAEPSTSSNDPGDPHHKNVLKCKKCPFVAKTVVDYSAHMTLHLNKKAYKCAACQKHFEQLSLLNEHFAAQHADLITSHKVCPHARSHCDCRGVPSNSRKSPSPEAIQRIPHGLQQTYHLLKMPLTSIPNLSTQDPGKPDEKQLKCNMCDFVAKWPAELQKHAVSHSEERPFMCMVCGSTYKWKWDMVKHFEKAHQSLSNPYKRREPGAPVGSALRDGASHHTHDSDSMDYDDTPPTKRARRGSDSSMPDLTDYSQSGPFGQDDSSVAGILAITQAATRMVSRQPNFLDDGPVDPQPSTSSEAMDLIQQANNNLGIQIAHVRSLQPGLMDANHKDKESDDDVRPINAKTQRAVANALKCRQNGAPKPHQSKPYSRPTPAEPSQLPYKCVQCEYRARWPSEITQHMKNHSNEKPYRCPLCTYRSKWKWDVVKHMRRCGTHPDGSPLTIKDVIDTTVQKKPKQAPPNAMVMPEGGVEPINPQPTSVPVPSTTSVTNNPIAFLVNTTNPEGQTTPTVVVPNLAATLPGEAPGMAPTSVSAALASLSLAQFQQTQAAVAAAVAASSNADSTPSTSQQAQSAAPKFRSLINGDKYVCLECPFVGNSPAELKRHQLLHSENKPFFCRTCGYSTRWKCDLKKHQKVYDHYAEDQDDMPGLPYACRTCGRYFSDTQLLAEHERKHSSSSPSATPSSRFVCKKCDFSANDLASLITHRKSQHPQNPAGPSSVSPVPGTGEQGKVEEQDEARLKHPRKPVKRLACTRCDFVCLKREALLAHEESHDREGYSCFYCTNTYDSKDRLLDHISSHAEFNPNEWETFFVDNDEDSDETEDVNNNSSSTNKASDNKPTMSSATLANTIDLSKSASSPPPPLVPVSQLTAASEQANTRRFECEWCSATFAHITTLYQHARNLHPLQLHDQEAAEMSKSASEEPPRSVPHSLTFASLNARAVSLNVTAGSNVTTAPVTTTPLQNSTPLQKAVASLQQRANGQLASMATIGGAAIFPFTSLASESKQGATSTSPANPKAAETPMNLTTKQQPQFQCTKCPYVGSTAQAYLRHIEQHSVQAPHSCLFCDFSTDRINKAYLHMRSSHPVEWAGLGQQHEQQMLSLIAKESLRHALQPNTEDTQDVVSAVPVPAVAASLNKDLLLQPQPPTSLAAPKEHFLQPQLPSNLPASARELLQQHIQASLSAAQNSLTAVSQNPLLATSQNALEPLFRKRCTPSYKGVPLRPLMADGQRIYQCLLCQFMSANVAFVAAHTRETHGPQGKYQCCYCNFSIDNLKLIQHHQVSAHPNQRIAIDVLMLEELTLAPKDSGVQAPVLAPKSELADLSEALKSAKMLRCLQCPFMVTTADRLRKHIACHNSNGKYQCRQCNFSTDEPSLLLEHDSVHEPFNTGSSGSGTTQTGAVNLSKDSASSGSETGTKDTPDADVSSKVKTPETGSSTVSKETKQSSALDFSSEVIAQGHASSEQAKSLVKKLRVAGGSGVGRIRYRCAECPYHTFCKNNIVKHRRQHVVKSRFQCGECSYSASRAFLLQQHEKFHQEAGNIETESSPGKQYQDIVFDPFDPALGSSVVGDDENDGEEDEMEIEVGDDDDDSQSSVDRSAAMHDSGKTADSEAKEIMEAEAANASGKSTPTFGVDASVQMDKQFRTYKCQHCPFSSNTPFEFRKHNSFHGTQFRYKCEYCSYSLDRLNLLTQHRRLHNDEPNFVLDPPISTLLNHEAILKPLSAAEAESMQVSMDSDDCSPSQTSTPAAAAKTDGAGEQVAGGRSITDCDTASASDLLVCPSCPYKTENQKAFAIHSSMHGLKRKYICDFCDWSADRLSLLYQHRRIHSSDPDFDPTPLDSIFVNQEFAEDVPGEFEAKILDMDPVSNGHEVQPSGSGSDLSPPFKLSITKKMYSCQECPYVTGSRASFDYHMPMHGGQGQYSCASCSYRTKRWSLLCQHSHLHEQPGSSGQKEKSSKEQSTADWKTGDKAENETNNKAAGKGGKDRRKEAESLASAKSPTTVDDELQCQRCPFCAPSKPELIRHVQQHAGPGTMVCPYCDFTGGDQDTLLPHIQLHFTAPLDLDNLRQLLAHQRREAAAAFKAKDKPSAQTRSSTESAKNSDKDGDQATDKSETTDEEAGSAKDKDAAKDSEVSTPQKTKVYVCQYCEREFESKTQMIQHERQHLV